MIRSITTGVLAALILASGSIASATPHTESSTTVITGTEVKQSAQRPGDHEHWLRHQCRFERLDDRGGYTTPEVARTIRCATWRWYRSHLPTVMCIAHRESGEALYAFADNPTSSASGVFQIVSGTWDSWRRNFAERREMFDLSPSVFDARSNVMTALFAMGAYGLGAWGDGCST